MRSKPLIILLVLAVVLVGIAVKTGRRSETAAPAALGKLLLPDLPVNDVERLTVVNQASTVTVTRVDGAWVLAEKHNYPANFGRVRDTLVTLSELKIGDQRRVTPETRQNFGVVPPAAAQPEATRLELSGKGGKPIASLLMGKSHLRKEQGGGRYGGGYPDGRYVSTDGGETVYLVKETLGNITAQGTSWIETELLNVDAAGIVRLTLAGPDREPLELSKQDPNGALTVASLSETEEADDAKLASLRNALAYLNLQDVADPSLSDAAMGFDAPISFTAESGDGSVYTLLVGSKTDDDARYLRGRAEFREPPVSSTNAADIATAGTNALAARTAVDRLNRKLGNWTFIIPSYKAEALVLTRADLVKPKAEPAPVVATPEAVESIAPPPAPAETQPGETTPDATGAAPAPAADAAGAVPTTAQETP